MRTIDPGLNHGWYDEAYLKAFGFEALGDNVKIHRTVMLPTAKGVSIGKNVTIGPYSVLMAEIMVIGNDVTIGSHCVFDGGIVEIADGEVIGHHRAITGEPIEEVVYEPPLKRRKR